MADSDLDFEPDAEFADMLDISDSGYDGPLHILLDLARRQKVDLLQISITRLADQYLSFVRSAKAERIDLAAEFLLMAAWLTLLKSRLLLPKPEKLSPDESLTSEAMVELLAFRLKRLQAMRDAVDALQNGPRLGVEVFTRGMPEHPKITPVRRYQADLWGVVSGIGRVKQRKEQDKPHVIAKQYVLPLDDARKTLKRFSLQFGDWALLGDAASLIDSAQNDWPHGSTMASLFSASLELVRDGDIDIKQDRHFGPILLRAIEAAQNDQSEPSSGYANIAPKQTA